MANFIEGLQYKIKTSSGSLMLTMARLFIGFILGLTFAIIGQQMMAYGDFAFMLVVIVSISAFYKIAQSWIWSNLAVFSFICVLIGALLKMYILIAPGA